MGQAEPCPWRTDRSSCVPAHVRSGHVLLPPPYALQPGGAQVQACRAALRKRGQGQRLQETTRAGQAPVGQFRHWAQQRARGAVIQRGRWSVAWHDACMLRQVPMATVPAAAATGRRGRCHPMEAAQGACGSNSGRLAGDRAAHGSAAATRRLLAAARRGDGRRGRVPAACACALRVWSLPAVAGLCATRSRRPPLATHEPPSPLILPATVPCVLAAGGVEG